jgi:hypothetical protein
LARVAVAVMRRELALGFAVPPVGRSLLRVTAL